MEGGNQVTSRVVDVLLTTVTFSGEAGTVQRKRYHVVELSLEYCSSGYYMYKQYQNMHTHHPPQSCLQSLHCIPQDQH